MKQQPNLQDDWRDIVLSDPNMILEDRDIMNALIAANERQIGSNIVDMRGIAMERLEARLDRLEDTHRAVISSAYENLVGTNQIHRAIICLMDQEDFRSFLECLGFNVAEILRVDCLHLVLENAQTKQGNDAPEEIQPFLSILKPGTITDYVLHGREIPMRDVTLRQVAPREAGPEIFGDMAADIRSEALLKLDLGPRHLPALLALGSEDPHQFKPTQGSDLLSFFAKIVERRLKEYLQ